MKMYLVIIAAMLFVFAANAQENKNENSKDEKIITIGMQAPDFTLEDAYGKKFTLSSFKGKSPVVVYFYPKANTAGCTKQACGIRDDWSNFEKNNIVVLGISTDSKKEILDFVEKNNLNFPLLSDASKETSKKYGVLNDNGYDKRVTYIINKKGEVTKIINVDDIDNHSKEVFDLAMKLK